MLITQTKCDQLEADLASVNLARCQDWEHNSGEKHIAINPMVKRKADLDVHQELPSFMSEGPRFFKTGLVQPKNKKQRQEHSVLPPTVGLDLSDEEVKRRTGFPTLGHLLSYIFIVCNGDIDVVMDRRSVLTWFEAWFMHFEFKWGRTLARAKDVSATYGPNPSVVRKEIALKYEIERRARDRWPTYATYDEDLRLRNEEKWGAKYNGLRPVMWDMANITPH